MLPHPQAWPGLTEQSDLAAVALSEGGDATQEADEQENKDKLQMGGSPQLSVGAGAGLQVVVYVAVRAGRVGSAWTEAEAE